MEMDAEMETIMAITDIKTEIVVKKIIEVFKIYCFLIIYAIMKYAKQLLKQINSLQKIVLLKEKGRRRWH